MTATLQAAPTSSAPIRRAVSAWDVWSDRERGSRLRRASGSVVRFLHLRRHDLAVLLPVLVAGMLVNAIGLLRYPRFTETEGALTVRSTAVDGVAALGEAGDPAPFGLASSPAGRGWSGRSVNRSGCRAAC